MSMEMTPILTVELPYVQQQTGIADCGVFAITFAVHLAFGNYVSRLTCCHAWDTMNRGLVLQTRNQHIYVRSA